MWKQKLVEFRVPWQSHSPRLHRGQKRDTEYLIENMMKLIWQGSEWSLPSTRTIRFLSYTCSLQALLGAGNISPQKIYSRNYVIKHLIVSIIRLLTTRDTHLPYKGLMPAHVAVHSCNSRSEVYRGNREVALRALSAPVKKSKPWKRPSESFPGQTELFFVPEKQLF